MRPYLYDLMSKPTVPLRGAGSIQKKKKRRWIENSGSNKQMDAFLRQIEELGSERRVKAAQGMMKLVEQLK